MIDSSSLIQHGHNEYSNTILTPSNKGLVLTAITSIYVNYLEPTLLGMYYSMLVERIPRSICQVLAFV